MPGITSATPEGCNCGGRGPWRALFPFYAASRPRYSYQVRAIIETVKAKASARKTKPRPDRKSPKARSRSAQPTTVEAQPQRIFLLSPANAAGLRANLIVSENAKFPLAQRLKQAGATLGEIFTFISGLYFRGKLAYAQAFVQPPAGLAGVYVITACGGLVPADTLLTTQRLRDISAGPIDAANPAYRLPLERDARILCKLLGKNCQVVLLGSVATPKYVEPLLGIFRERLLFPAEFVGRGDMSRGGLMLRCAREGVQLTYVPVASAVRHGAKPPKLPKLPRGYYLQAASGTPAAK